MALLVTVLAMALVTALASAVVINTSSEILIAANFRDARATLTAADAIGQWAFADLGARVSDWAAVAAGSRQSAFVDGPPGRRRMQTGEQIDVGAVLLTNPGWMLYAHGWLNDLLPPMMMSDAPAPEYVVVLVAGDPASADRLRVRSVAFGPHGARRALQLTLVRGPGGILIESWEAVV